MSSSYRTQCEKVIQTKGIQTISFAHGENNVPIMSFIVVVDGFPMSFAFIVNEPAEQVTITSRPTWVIPERLFNATWEFIMKLNYKLVCGHVDLDERDGEVRYKTSADFGKAKKIESILEHYMNLHLTSGKQYLRSLKAMKDDGISVRDALSRLGIDDYGPSGIFDTADRDAAMADNARSLVSRELAPMTRPSPTTRQGSQEELEERMKAIGLGRP